MLMGLTLIEQGNNSHQNYLQKPKTWLEWAYQIACENNQKESECRKKYYDRKMRCMSLRPNDLVLVHVKAPTGDHKIADRWEVTPHCVPFFKVQPMNAEDDENVHILHMNMLFPIQLLTPCQKTDDSNFTLMKAILLMDLHFDN